MSSQVAGKSLRNMNYGSRVARATSNLAQTGNLTLFTVTGGRVIVTTLLGEVTTAIQAQANAILIRSIGTAGSTTTNLHSSWDSNAAALGTLVSIPGVAATAVTTGGSVVQGNEFILPAGSIQMNAAASNTGQMSWTVLYVPLDDGAAIVAA